MNELSAGSYDPPEAFPKPCLPEPRQHLTRQEQQPAPWSLMAPRRLLFLFESSGARPRYHFPLWAVAREPLKKIMLPPPVWITGSRCLILENAKASLSLSLPSGVFWRACCNLCSLYRWRGCGMAITEVWTNAPEKDGWSTLVWTSIPKEFLTNLTIVNTEL